MTDYTFTNDDGSTSSFTIPTPAPTDYTWTPGPPVVCPPAPLMRLGTSFKSATDAANWPNSQFGLIFFNPSTGHPFDLNVVRAAVTAWPKILWCICDKGNPLTSIPSLATLPGSFWYAYNQEPEGSDPAAHLFGVRSARSAIDAAGARGRIILAGKFARYPNIAKPGTWKSYWAGTKDNPVEEVFASDDYARPGLQFPTTRYGTAEELYGWARDAAASCGVPHAITETARLVIPSDPQGSALAGVVDDDVAWARANQTLIWSYWPGLGGALDASGKPVDFTPPALVRSEIRTMIRSQG